MTKSSKGTRRGTFLASSTQMLWRQLENHDIDPLHVYRRAGLDPALMAQPRGRYLLDQVVAAVKLAEELTGSQCLGLEVGKGWKVTDHHALGYAFLSSSTLRTALGRLVRYFKVINENVRFCVEDGADKVHIRFSDQDWLEQLPRTIEDARWGGIVAMCREASGGRVDPLEVCFHHDESACRAEYFGWFRCPVVFASSESRLTFDRKDVDRPLPASNRELAHANDRILASFVRDLTEDDLITRIKSALIEELPSGNPGDALIARAVYLSPRTMQRRLAEEGTSYTQVLDEVRRELAENYISDPDVPLNEVSYLLGFSEMSSFSRAFKRWTGKSPSGYRAGSVG